MNANLGQTKLFFIHAHPLLKPTKKLQSYVLKTLQLQQVNEIFFSGRQVIGRQGRPLQVRGPVQDLGAGPNARPRRGAPLSSDFMTSSCSINRVTIVVERRCKALTRELSTFANVRQQRKFGSSDESVLC